MPKPPDESPKIGYATPAGPSPRRHTPAVIAWLWIASACGVVLFWAGGFIMENRVLEQWPTAGLLVAFAGLVLTLSAGGTAAARTGRRYDRRLVKAIGTHRKNAAEWVIYAVIAPAVIGARLYRFASSRRRG